MSQNSTKFLDVVILNWRHVSAPAVGRLQVTKVYSISHKIYKPKIQRDLVVVQYSIAVHD